MVVTRTVARRVFASYLLFLACNVCYFFFFVYARPITSLRPAEGFHLDYYNYFYFPVNYDYLKIAHIFQDIERGSWAYWSSANFFVLLFYYHTSRLTGLGYDLLSFIVNNFLVIGAYLCCIRAMTAAGWPTRYSFAFFLNPQLVYYSQVINKEMPALFLVMLLTCLAVERKRALFLAAALLAILVRQHFVLYAGFLMFLQTARRFRLRLALAYVASAVARAVALSVGLDGEGMIANARFLRFALDVDRQFYITNLVLAPIRIAQWIYEQLRSLWFITPEGYINLYFLRDVIPILMLLWLLPTLVGFFRALRIHAAGRERILLSSVVAFVLMQLVHPLVQQRYYFPLVVLLLMLGLGRLALLEDAVAAQEPELKPSTG
jgi:hypothetical protein